MEQKNTQREVYIPWDPVIEAYRRKLLKAGNSPEVIEDLFAKRDTDIKALWKKIQSKVNKVLW